jgi:hypothetical protein
MSYHKTLGSLFEDLNTKQTSPRKAPMVLLESSPSNFRRLLSIFENYSLRAFHQTPSVQTIFTPINRFSFQTLVLSSYTLSMTMYLTRTYLWHVFFHSFHCHLVNRGHHLIVSVLFLRLIKSLTIRLLSDAVLLTLLNFEINCSETILCPIPHPFDLL